MSKPISLCPGDREHFLPDTFRLTSLRNETTDDWTYLNEAVIFHDPHFYEIQWESVEAAVFQIGSLVAIEWEKRATESGGIYTVKNLVERLTPSIDTNLFWTVPDSWVENRKLIEHAGDLWEGLSPKFKMLFNAIFWREGRLYSYVRGASLRSPRHDSLHGSLTHCMEVTLMGRQLGKIIGADEQVLMMAGFLYDAVAFEHDFHEGGEIELKSMDEVRLKGHRLAVCDWIRAARTINTIDIPEDQLLALEHAIVAVDGLPQFAGLPEPSTTEAQILSKVARLSGLVNIFDPCLKTKEQQFWKQLNFEHGLL